MIVQNVGCVVNGNSSMSSKISEANKKPVKNEELDELYISISDKLAMIRRNKMAHGFRKQGINNHKASNLRRSDRNGFGNNIRANG